MRIEQRGTYACRNVDSERAGPRSEHATANAIDIAGCVLSNGRVITVAHDWKKPTPEGAFLAGAHAGACRVFNGVLGPEYTRLHADHFHLDPGRYRVCRWATPAADLMRAVRDSVFTAFMLIASERVAISGPLTSVDASCASGTVQCDDLVGRQILSVRCVVAERLLHSSVNISYNR